MLEVVPPSESLPGRIWRGQLSLATTFWLVFFLPNIALRILSVVVPLLSIWIAHPLLTSESQSWGMAAFFIQMSMLALTGIVDIAYLIFSIVAVWRSAGNYQGLRLWSFAARGYLIISVLFAGADGVSAIHQGIGKKKMSSQEALTYAQAHAIPTKEFPLSGWWGNRCTKGPDFAIMPALTQSNPVKYSIVFCGSGCFSPGTYRPDTTITGDDHYHVISNDVIEMDGASGWDRIFRCQSHDSTPGQIDQKILPALPQAEQRNSNGS